MKGKIPALAKRSLALALALALLLSLCPVLPLTAKAAHAGEWTYKDSFQWINGSFKTEDADLVYEEGQPYDWSVIIKPERTPPPSADVVATIKDADGNVVSEYSGTTTGLAQRTEGVLCSAANFPELTADLEGTFTLTCQMLYKGAIYAQLVQTFSRGAAGSAVETTEGAEVETTVATEPEATEATEPEEEVYKFTEGWTYKPSNEWINGCLTSKDADQVYAAGQPFDWTVFITPQRDPGIYEITVEADIKDAEGNVVASIAPKPASFTPKQPAEMLNAAEFTDMPADLAGVFTLTCSLKIGSTTYAQLVHEFSREGGETPEDPEIPDDPEIPEDPEVPEVPANAIAKAYLDILQEVVLENITACDGFNFTANAPFNLKTIKDASRDLVAWDMGPNVALQFTLSEEFMQNFEGEATVTVEYVESSNGTAQLVYPTADNNAFVHETKMAADGTNTYAVKAVTFKLTDATFTGLFGKDYSFAVMGTPDSSGRFYLKSVTVTLPAAEAPAVNYNLELNSEAADLVFYDETPFDLDLTATTDGNISVVDVSYYLEGGNLAEPITGTKTVPVSKEGVSVLDAAWFNENAQGFGEFILEVSMTKVDENGEVIDLSQQVFIFSRTYTSILDSELTSATAEQLGGILVFGEDDAMDLELFLRNKLAVPFNGTLTYTVYYNDAIVEGYEDLPVAITDLIGDAAKVDITLPETDAYGYYDLIVMVHDENGDQVHGVQFTFARLKAEFVSTSISSATAGEELVFVDEAPYDLMLTAQKTDGADETLYFSYEIVKGEESVKVGEFSADVTANAATEISLADILADVEGFGIFTLKLTVGNRLSYTNEFSYSFSRIESVKVDLTSETSANLVFIDDQPYDLQLSLLKQSGEDAVYTVNYTVTSGEEIVKTGSIADVSVTETANIQALDMTGVEGNGNFTITVTLVDGEGNTVKTVPFQVTRKTSLTAALLHPGALTLDGRLTYIDHVPYDFAVSLQKPQGDAENMTIAYIIQTPEGETLISNNIEASIGSAEATVVPLDMMGLDGYGAYKMAISVQDASGNELVATSLIFARIESIYTQLVSATNPDLIFTESEPFDLVLRLQNISGRTERLSVTYTITNDNGEVLREFKTPLNLGSAVVPATINQFTDLSDLTAVGTYYFNLTIVDGENRLREQVTYTFSRVSTAGTVESAVTSESSPNLTFVPGGNIDMVLHIKKTDGVQEGFAATLTFTDKDGNEVMTYSNELRPFTSVKLNLADFIHFATFTEAGIYNMNLTLTDDSGNVRHEASFPFTLVSLEGSVEAAVTSTTNPDMIFTEGEAFDLILHMRKTDGVPEEFRAVITVTDKDGNKLKEKEAKVPARESIKVPVNDLVDLSDLPATGTFALHVVLTDATGNERLSLDQPFCRVKLASVKTQISSNTNKDMIFTDNDVVDLMLYAQKTDGVPEELILHYSILDPDGNEIATAEGKTTVPASPNYFKLPIELAAEDVAAHGRYKAILTVMDTNGNIRSETETPFVRISGTGIKHQISGSSTGTKMQFTPGMKIDLCLFAQKTDGVPESVQANLYVTSPSGQVIHSITGKLNIPAGSSYFKYALPLDGKCTEFGTYKVTYTFHDDAGTLRVSNVASFKMISPTGEMAVAVQSSSNKFPGLIYGRDDAFDLVLFLQKADGVEQTLKLRYTISDMNGLVLETKEGSINVPALGYRKIPIELPDIDAFDKFGIFNMKVEVAGPTGVLIYSETFSFSRVLTPEKQLDVLGVCTHLAKKGMTGPQSQQYVELARRAGASFWRDELPWSTVEPAKGQYKIPAVCDSAVDYTLSIGLEPLFILDYGNSNYGSDVTTDEWLEGYLGYVEYVVTHFKGRIKYYEVWNEWNIGLGGLDKKYRDYPELYARILIPTYKLIKEIDPSITVIGGVVAGGEEEWTEGLFKCPGVMDSMDAFSFHEYSDNDIKDIIEQTETVRELLTKYGKPDMPLWLTETSWPTHIGRNSFSEEESAGNLVSLYTWAMANPGVLDQIFWYDLHNDGVERENMEHNFGLLQNWDLDKNNVPMAAKPSYVALSAMNAILIDAECLGLYDLGQKGITAYRFKKDGKDMLVAWADDKALNMIANVGDNNIIVTDMYGNASALAPVDGKVSLFFSDAPIYIEYDLTNKLEMVEGGFELDQQEYSVTPAVTFPVKITRNNGLQAYSGSYVFSLPDGWSVEGAEFAPAADGATEIIDTVYITVSDDAPKGKSTLSVRVVSGTNIMGQFTVPVEMGDICTVNPDVVFTEDGHEFKLSVEIQNAMSNKPLKGTINLLAPSALLGDSSSIPFEAPAGENKAFLLDMPADVANTFYEVKLEIVLDSGVKHEVTKPVSFLYAIKAPEGMKLDGVIDDQWDGAMAFTAGEDDWLNHTGSDLEWPGNTFTGYAMWDDEYLYVAVEAYDVSHYQNGTGTSIWMGDSIQMGTDINRFYVPGELGYNDIGFSLSSEDGTIENWNWNAAPGKNVSKGGIFKVVRNDEACTTTYEVALPWSELMADGVDFKDYDQKNIGFSLLVNENSIDEDGEPTGRTGWIEYMSGIGVRKDPTKYGDLILVERPEK